MVIRLSRQIVHVNAFASFIDVGRGCFRMTIEATAFLYAGVFFAARLNECVSGRGCEFAGVKTGIDFAQIASIRGAIHDVSFGMKWREIKSHFGKLTACFGEARGFGFRNRNRNRSGRWWWLL